MDQKKNPQLAGGENRRKFITRTAAAAAVVAVNPFKTPVYGQDQAPSANVAGANEKIIVGHIGVGGQGGRHVRAMTKNHKDNNTESVAVCDVWEKRRLQHKANAENNQGNKVDMYSDHRKLCERKDIDAIVVATVDHWHAPIAIDAMEAGKHIYCEKPMTRYLDEAFRVYDVAKKTGKKVQVGSQAASDAKWHKAAELARDGSIGPLVLGQDSYMRNAAAKGGEWNYKIQEDARPDNLDWKRWMGPINRKTPFNPDHFFRWRKYLPYCAGLLGDLAPHRLHPLMLASGNPQFPSRVMCTGTRKISLDRDCTDSTQILAEFPSGLVLLVTTSSVSEHGLQSVMRGHHARLEFGGNRVNLIPERPFGDEIDPEEFTNLTPGEDVEVHEKDFFDSIRENREPNCGIELAIRTQTVISLAEMSERLSVACLFDEKTRKITTGEGTVLEPITYGTLPLS
jgi:predicted dehydrogenase